jgi:hypothetical protein
MDQTIYWSVHMDLPLYSILSQINPVHIHAVPLECVLVLLAHLYIDPDFSPSVWIFSPDFIFSSSAKRATCPSQFLINSVFLTMSFGIGDKKYTSR